MPVVKLTVSDSEMALLRLWANGSAIATLAKHAVMLKATSDLGTHQVPTKGTSGTHPVPSTHPVPAEGTASTPGDTSPDLSKNGTSIAHKNTEEEKKKSKKKEESRLAPLSISKEVIGYLNEMAGTDMKPNAAGHRKLIQARLNDGATVQDFKTVIDKKCKEWLGETMQTNLKPSCLFAACHFDDYLGQLDSVKQKPLAFTDGEKRAERYTDRKKTKYPTNRTRGQT